MLGRSEKSSEKRAIFWLISGRLDHLWMVTTKPTMAITRTMAISMTAPGTWTTSAATSEATSRNELGWPPSIAKTLCVYQCPSDPAGLHRSRHALVLVAKELQAVAVTLGMPLLR
jgi:hypothetical protein